MPSRIDVELTSARPDGTWTWRAAGAREPKGVVGASLLPSDAKVGDVFKVEALIALDGIEIQSVVPNRAARKEPERLEILGGGDFQAVTTSLVGKRDRDRDGDRGRRDRRPGDRGPGDRAPGARRDEGRRPPRGDTKRGDAPRATGTAEGQGQRPAGRAERAARPPRERRERPSYAPVPEVPQRPKPKRLKPGRAHRQQLLASLPDEHKPIADQLFRGGLPGVRQALQEQNAALRAEGRPEITTSGIEALAQDLLPRVRVAEWMDRAEAAMASVDDLDLRDLRSVVTAAADPMVARDDATRELSAELRDALERRQNEEHAQWLADITVALDVGRVVRALRLSSRPPKAGVPFSPELSSRLADAALAALTPDAASDRWAAVIEALAFSPVHAVVIPAAPPQHVSDELRALVKGVGSAVPQIAALLEVEVAPPGRRSARPPRLPRRPAAAKPRSARAIPPPPGHPDAPRPEPAAEPERAEASEPVAEPATPTAEPDVVAEPETPATEAGPAVDAAPDAPTAEGDDADASAANHGD